MILDRSEPQSLEFEQALIGALVTFPERIQEVVDIVKPGDFYRGVHGSIFQILAERSNANLPCDMLAVSKEISKAGIAELSIRRLNSYREMVDQDMSPIHFLQACTETVGWEEYGVEWYAAEIAEYARLRRIRAFGERTHDRAFSGATSAEALKAIDAEFSQIIEEPSGQIQIHEAQPLAKEVYDQIIDNDMDEARVVIRTGMPDLDRHIGRLKPGAVYTILGRPGGGKAQPIESPVLTPAGFVPISAIKVGDHVMGADGKRKSVLGIHPQGRKEVFRVTMRDGTSTLCCDDHLWFTQSRLEFKRGERGSVKSLAEIRKQLRVAGEPNREMHRIPANCPMEYGNTDALPIDPWLLGVLIGDGCLTNGAVISNPETYIHDRVSRSLPDSDESILRGDNNVIGIRRKQYNGKKSSTTLALESLGLMNTHSYEKFIPHKYLVAPVKDRVELLRGLMDTDGHVHTSGGTVEYSTSSAALSGNILTLMRSLGCRPCVTMREPVYSHNGEKRVVRTSYRIRCSFPKSIVPVSSPKHLARWRPESAHSYIGNHIRSVEYFGVCECVCITVEGDEGLYLTDDFIVTHNSSMALQIADHVADHYGAVLFVTLEMTPQEMSVRHIAMRARVDGMALDEGKLTSEDWDRVRYAIGNMGNHRLRIVEPNEYTLQQILLAIRRAHRREPLSLIVVDFIQQIMSEGKRDENRNLEIGRFVGGLKLAAKNCKCPLIQCSQMNREIEKRSERAPKLSDSRDSGAIETLSHAMIYIIPNENSDANGHNQRDYSIYIKKARGGMTGKYDTWYRPAFASFDNRVQG